MPNTLLIAGHRDISEETVTSITSTALSKMGSYDTLITGMAKGVDIIAAETCLEKTDWKIIAAIPCYGQEAKWEEEWQKRYWAILSNSRVKVVYVTSGAWTKGCYFTRNNWMVKRCTAAILFMHDKKSGTGNTCQSLEKSGKRHWIYDPVAKLWLE